MSATAVTPEKARPNKKPINRKIAALSFVGLGVLMVFGLIAVTLNDPRKAAQEKATQARTRELAALPAGNVEQGQRVVDDLSRKADDARKAEEARQVPVDPLAALSPSGNGRVVVPAIDPRILALDQAQQEIMRTAPPPGQLTPRVSSNTFTNIAPEAVRGVQQPSGFGAHEKYVATALPDANVQRSTDAGAEGFYETVKPQAPPSARVLVQGSTIAAVLVSRIDTRNAGPLLARVTRAVYDSQSARIALIPQGSRLVGRYETNVGMGVDRVTAIFDRLVLPDGRAVPLPGFVGGGLDGTSGLNGRFHSNILRAIGPSFVVALIGQVLDKEINPDNNTSNGFQTQAPTVAQQVFPKVNDAVLDRYSAAKPYFTAEPGQELRLILTADIEVPAVMSPAQGPQ